MSATGSVLPPAGAVSSEAPKHEAIAKEAGANERKEPNAPLPISSLTNAPQPRSRRAPILLCPAAGGQPRHATVAGLRRAAYGTMKPPGLHSETSSPNATNQRRDAACQPQLLESTRLLGGESTRPARRAHRRCKQHRAARGAEQPHAGRTGPAERRRAASSCSRRSGAEPRVASRPTSELLTRRRRRSGPGHHCHGLQRNRVGRPGARDWRFAALRHRRENVVREAGRHASAATGAAARCDGPLQSGCELNLASGF